MALDANLSQRIDRLVGMLQQAGQSTTAKTLKDLKSNYERTAAPTMYLWLDPQRIGSRVQHRYERWARKIEQLRNIAVLFPLMLTWLSLGLAAVAYAENLAKYPDSLRIPFLAMWQQGFQIPYVSLGPIDVPLSFGNVRFTFAGVAGLDVILLAVLVVLTFSCQLVFSIAASRAQAVQRDLDDVLHELSTQSFGSSLGSGLGAEAPQWAVLVNSSVEALNRTVTEVRESVTRTLQEIETSVRRAQQSFEGTVQRFTRAADDQARLAAQQSDDVRRLQKSASEVTAFYMEVQRKQEVLEGELVTWKNTLDELIQREAAIRSALSAVAEAAQRSAESSSEVTSVFTSSIVATTGGIAQQQAQTQAALNALASRLGVRTREVGRGERRLWKPWTWFSRRQGREPDEQDLFSHGWR